MAALKHKILSLVDHGEVGQDLVFGSFLPGYHRDTINKSLNRLTQEGMVEIKLGNYFITSEGVRELKGKYPFYRYKESEWDGLWRLVFFDIPEVDRSYRDRFRKDLKIRGFGLWQNSVWVSPYDQDFHEDASLLPSQVLRHLELFKGIRLSKGDEIMQADQIWGVTPLNGMYEKVYTTWQERLSDNTSGDVSKIRSAAATLQESYLSLLLKDPGLPKKLLPETWHRESLEATSWQWRSFLSL